MTTAATSLLGLALPVTGELSGTWGDTVNNSITSLLDSAIAGTTTLSADADVTLTTTTLSANQARSAIILWTAGGTATRTITAPAQSKPYIVINKTSSTQSIIFIGATGAGVTLVAGEKAVVSWNGVDFVKVANQNGTGNFTSLITTDNVGIGVTPSAWGSSYKAVQFANGNIYSLSSVNDTSFGSNFYVDASGNAKYLNTTTATLYRQATGAHIWYAAPSGTAGNTITFTQAMTLDASGNLGIGTTSPQAKIHTVDVASGNPARFQGGESNYTIRIVNSANTSGGSINANTGTAQGITISSDSGPMIFNAASSERARIDSSGNLLVGQSSYPFAGQPKASFISTSTTQGGVASVQPNSATASGFTSQSVTAAGLTWFHFVGQSGNGSAITTNNILIYGNGDVKNTNNSYGAISDVKLKENIVDATPKLANLMQVKVRNYNLKGDYEQHKQIGVIAQELEQVFPGMVDETADKDMEGNDLGTTTKSVKYSVFVPMLIKAIQEQQALITSLTARLDAAGL